MRFRSLAASAAVVCGIAFPASAGGTPFPKPLAIPRSRPVVRVFDVAVSYGEYLAILKQGWPAWDLLLALPGGDRLPELATPQEWLFQHEWAEPEMMRHLFFEDQRAALEKRALECYRRARNGENWTRLVEEFSTDPDGPRYQGKLGFVSIESVHPPFGRVLFRAPIGEVQKPVLTVLGWNVGRVVAIQPPRQGHPEMRSVEQILIGWKQLAGLGEEDAVAIQDVRPLMAQLKSAIRVTVLDERLCPELPHFCKANAGEKENVRLQVETGASGEAPKHDEGEKP